MITSKVLYKLNKYKVGEYNSLTREGKHRHIKKHKNGLNTFPFSSERHYVTFYKPNQIYSQST